jgi:hypothetical protein
MITENEIIQAIRSMTDIRGQYSPAIQDIASLLEEAMDQDHFDGTLQNAIKYLTGQGYEVELE